MYANDFTEIPIALAEMRPLRERVIALIQSEAIPESLVGHGGRTKVIRGVLEARARGLFSQHAAARELRLQFSDGEAPQGPDWAVRVLHPLFSSFYNQAVLEELIDRGIDECFVPATELEAADSPCALHLADKVHSVCALRTLLLGVYRRGVEPVQRVLPAHPNCMHVARPFD